MPFQNPFPDENLSLEKNNVSNSKYVLSSSLINYKMIEKKTNKIIITFNAFYISFIKINYHILLE